MKKKGSVLIAAPVHPVLLDGLVDKGYEPFIRLNINQDEAAQCLYDCVGVITSTRLKLDKALIDAAPNLQFIGRLGSGMEIIDVAYAASKSILCISSPEGNCNAVAEHALGMLLSLNKKITTSHQEVKSGMWERDANRGIELSGKTIGIIGYGHTGPAFAKLLSAFDMRILVYDKYRTQPLNDSNKIEWVSSLQPIYDESEFVSIHLPATVETKHYVNDAFVEQFLHPFVLINTSRGNIIDSRCIEKHLRSGKIKGMLLDVWEQEPYHKENNELKTIFESILNYSNVLVTPHIAGYSLEATYKMSKHILDKLNASYLS
jgi:D-3-phosphoglycerate dehydrogenase